MKPLSKFHEYFSAAHGDSLNVLQCVNMTPLHGLRPELTRSRFTTIDLLTRIFEALTGDADGSKSRQFFSDDEILHTIIPLPGRDFKNGEMIRISAEDESITVDQRRRYIDGELLTQVAAKLKVVLSDPVSHDEIRHLSSVTLEAFLKLNSVITGYIDAIN